MSTEVAAVTGTELTPAAGTPEAKQAPVATPAGDKPVTQPGAASSSEQGTFGTAVTYQPSGDSNLDLALAFAGRHGLDADHPAMKEASKGNFAPIRAILSEKNVPGWEAHVALAEKGFSDFTKATAEKVLAVQGICTRAAGGEAEWGEVLNWASANAEPHEKEAVNAALSGGGVVAEAMAAFLVHSYRSAPGTTVEPQRRAVNHGAAASSHASGQAGPLSPAAYASEVAKLAQQGQIEGSREYAALQQRRAMWRG